MTDRWPSMYDRGLRWAHRTEKKVMSLGHPDQGTMVSIINAIEYQFEAGAYPATLHHLLAALLAQASSCTMPLSKLGLDRTPEHILENLHPQTR